MRRLFVVLAITVLPLIVLAGPTPRHSAIAAPPPNVQFEHVCGAVPVGFARCHAIVMVKGNNPHNRTPTPTSATTSISTTQPSATPTSTGTPTDTPTATDTPTTGATATPTDTTTATNTATATDTPVATATSTSTGPRGYGPADLLSAYNLAAASAAYGSTQTVGIVDAYDDPYAEADLAVYRAQYGLPACTTVNGCFKKVDQNGFSIYPLSSGGWAQEISLDLDMVSAICPKCHILLVEASSNSFVNLGTAVNEAVALGANTVSNSYGGSESSTSYAAYYDHPGHVITASSGDGGYGVEVPAGYSQVTAVGGTSLKRSGSSWTESAWSGAGSGCSAYTSRPVWQSITNITSTCSRRALTDVSAVADPNTGVAVYDSFTYRGYSGWLVFGGTSVASPIIASVYALAGNASTVTYGSYPYSNTASLNDVTSGSNGSCGGTDLCTAGTGWDGPTGLGTPNGTGAF